MPFSGDPAILFDSVLADVARIERFTEGMDHAGFQQEDGVSYAVKYGLLRISEAAHRLGSLAAELCPEVDWRDIRGLGNHLRHAYDTIDSGLIWMIVKKDLPPLRTFVEAALLRLRAGATGN